MKKFTKHFFLLNAKDPLNSKDKFNNAIFHLGGSFNYPGFDLINYKKILNNNADTVLMGLNFDFFYKALYLPKKNISFLGKNFLYKRLNNLSKDIVNQFIDEIGFKLKTADPFVIFKNKKTAVFLGRDGIINKKMDKGVKNIKEFIILPKIGQAIAKLNLNNIPCFIVSNQSVLAKKQITLEHFKEIIIYLDKYLSNHKAYIDDFLFCANYKNIKYNDKKISFFYKFRKPNPGMILCLAKKYNINLRKSYLIGDNDTDILAGKLANLKTILVESIKTKNYGLSIKPDFIVKNLYQAVNLILRHRI